MYIKEMSACKTTYISCVVNRTRPGEALTFSGFNICMGSVEYLYKKGATERFSHIPKNRESLGVFVCPTYPLCINVNMYNLPEGCTFPTRM